MLKITIPAIEMFDDQTQTFISTEEQTLELQHSLVSVSKWESKWCKPFLRKEPKTFEETVDYIKCMTVTENVDPNVYSSLTQSNVNEINAYIEAPMTATTFYGEKQKSSKDIITTELIYYWMISLNIPMECQNWHLNRLLTLIRVCNEKNAPAKKMSRREAASRYASLNAARRNKLNTRG